MQGKVIAVDFDRTITDSESIFPKMGRPNKKLIEKMREWSKDNIIVIWTSRSGQYIQPMVDYLIYHNIPFHYINDNPYNTFVPQSRKIHADVYIDDKAVNLNYMDIEELEEVLNE